MIVVGWCAVLFARLSLLCTLNPGVRGGPALLVALSGFRAKYDGAEGRDGSHDERDAAFQNLPKDLPHTFETAEIWSSRCAYDHEYDHHRGETKKEAESEFLLCFDLYSSKNDNGNADNFLKRLKQKQAGLKTVGKEIYIECRWAYPASSSTMPSIPKSDRGKGSHMSLNQFSRLTVKKGMSGEQILLKLLLGCEHNMSGSTSENSHESKEMMNTIQ